MVEAGLVYLGELEAFVRVANKRSYSAAARTFPYPITQPAVFKQVKKLEDAVGKTLFTRKRHDELALTPEGQTLYAYAQPFVSNLPDVLRNLDAEPGVGTLRIDASGIALRYLIPKWIRKATRRYPRMRVELREPHEDKIARLRDMESDLAIDVFPGLDEPFATRKVGRVYAFLVGPNALKGLTPKTLTKHTFVAYPPDDSLFALQQQALTEFGVTPQRVTHANSAETILSFVEAGLGFSFIPWLDSNGPTRRGVAAKRFGGARGVFPLMAVWRRESPTAPLAELFCRLAS